MWYGNSVIYYQISVTQNWDTLSKAAIKINIHGCGRDWNQCVVNKVRRDNLHSQMVFKYDQYGPAALHISSSSHITGHRLNRFSDDIILNAVLIHKQVTLQSWADSVPEFRSGRRHQLRLQIRFCYMSFELDRIASYTNSNAAIVTSVTAKILLRGSRF